MYACVQVCAPLKSEVWAVQHRLELSGLGWGPEATLQMPRTGGGKGEVIYVIHSRL